MRSRALLASLVVLTACRPEDVIHRFTWFSAMVTQRSIRPYAKLRPPVEGTVPVTGPPAVVDADATERMPNPRTRTSESVNNGKGVYETYCLVCHGETGRGDGPVSSAAGGPFVGIRSLVTDTVGRRPDGYLYGVIVNAQVMGRGLMPRYGDKIAGSDRWDLVNYIRTLQALERGKAGGHR
ncbi:MAG TPA: cytochrome c [Gemmatimonadales bacterium]|nr:cytochrome c [Gemmatimonadales bacterium]